MIVLLLSDQNEGVPQVRDLLHGSYNVLGDTRQENF